VSLFALLVQMTPPPDAPGQQQQHPQKPSGAAKAKERAAQVGKEVKTAVPQVVQAARTVEVVVYRTIACNKCVLACQGRGGQPMGFKVCTNPLQVLQVCKCAIGMKAKQAAAGVAAAAVAAAKSAVPKP
jgi:hypothetical protein